MATEPTRPTDALRRERERIRLELASASDLVGKIPRDLTATRSRLLHVVSTLEAIVGPYLEWEERVVHPVVDRLACGGPMVVSASLRFEHALVHRGLDELARSARSQDPDPVAFARRADRLLGLLEAHLEVEDTMFLPLLDGALGSAATASGVGSKKRA